MILVMSKCGIVFNILNTLALLVARFVVPDLHPPFFKVKLRVLEIALIFITLATA